MCVCLNWNLWDTPFLYQNNNNNNIVIDTQGGELISSVFTINKYHPSSRLHLYPLPSTSALRTNISWSCARWEILQFDDNLVKGIPTLSNRDLLGLGSCCSGPLDLWPFGRDTVRHRVIYHRGLGNSWYFAFALYQPTTPIISTFFPHSQNRYSYFTL